MTQDLLEYPKMMERALRGVMREALAAAADQGLPGQHHFYITFRTTDAGVALADHLVAQNPDTMTIVLEHKFWGLEVDDDGFAVTLSFGGKSERLEVPFQAVTSFVDPSVKFGLQFEAPGAGEDAPPDPVAEEELDEPGESEDGRVVALDRFRKK